MTISDFFNTAYFGLYGLIILVLILIIIYIFYTSSPEEEA